MSSNADSKHAGLDAADPPSASPADVKTLGRLRWSVASWLRLGPDEIEALLPPTVPNRPPLRPDATPFELD